jgi:hypothetical protein
MASIVDRDWWGYVGRFSLVHLVAYALVGLVFVSLQDALPAADRVAIEFFEPYRPFDGLALLSQVARGAVLALVLIPFYDAFVRRDRGMAILFGVVWGLTIVASIEPMPGSIEGVIYTETSAMAHGVVLAATAVQSALFALAFLAWERRASGVAVRPEECEEDERPIAPESHSLPRYVARFALLYPLVYLVAGLAFMQLQNYESVLATREAFELYRPLDHPMVAAALPIQVFRGGLIALLVAPFYDGIVRHDRGWLRLFGLLWGFTFLGAPHALLGLATDLVSTGTVGQVLFGTAEVTAQMAIFAVLFWAWQRRAVDRRGYGDGRAAPETD